MSRLPLVDPSHAQGKAHDLFEAVRSKMGRVPNMMKAMANSPAVLEGYLGLGGALAGGSLDPRCGSGSRSNSPRPTAATTALRPTPCSASSPGSTTGAHAARLGESSDPKADAALKFARTLLDNQGDVADEDVRRVKEAGYADGEVAEIIAWSPSTS